MCRLYNSLQMKNLFFYFSLILCFSGYAQNSESPQELFDEGQFFFNRGEYKEALYYFKRLVDTDKENANFNYKVGECYLNIEGMEYKAVPYFEKAAEKVVPKKDYKGRDFYETKAPLHALFYLGNAYRVDGNLDMALKAYDKFVDSPYYYGNYNLRIVKDEIKSCERAKIIQDSPIDYSSEPLESTINTTFSESNPVISADEKTLVFLRGLKFYNAVYVSKLIDGKWQEPVNISQEIVSEGDFYPTGINSDGTEILFTRTFENRADIYSSKFDGKKWSKAERISGKINSLANETFASFADNDRTIYFVSDRQKGRGGKDIFISKREKNGSWSKAKNLGKTINTDLDEDTPVFCTNTNKLYFSSKGHYNMGGYDIFTSKIEAKKWNIPRNIGYPVNTTNNDRFFMVTPEGNSGYYSIIDKETGYSDIYYIKIKSVMDLPDEEKQ